MPAMPPDPAFSVQIAVRELQHDGTVIAQSVLRLGMNFRLRQPSALQTPLTCARVVAATSEVLRVTNT